jgi:UDP-N-acetylmuramyl pentapeptide phosphotransferase/UDP-N-acetylglucosamine-1-phosphate transferase|tara:strand:+ start:11150 stop:12163 length:1014 start_codon:yes stop_codon:yes gene_type:complete
MTNFLFLIFPIIILIINYIVKKNFLIPNYSGEIHQKFIGKKEIPLSGGLYFFLFTMYLFFNQFSFFLVFFFIIFFLGFISDIRLLTSPKQRFFLQAFSILIFTYYSELNIELTRMYILDIILENFFWSCIFTSFCLMILVNGTNFIDGLNGLVLSYYSILLIIIFKLGLFEKIYIDDVQIISLITILFFLIILNFLNQLYLGDSGSYSIAFLVGFFLLSIYENYSIISPFFIVLLLWYPAFETLFSIIRKLKLKRSPIYPDNNHFHQLLFLFIKKRFKVTNNKSNNLTSILIIVYNLIIFTVATIDIYHSNFQILLILLNVTVYSFLYLRLFKYKIK